MSGRTVPAGVLKRQEADDREVPFSAIAVNSDFERLAKLAHPEVRKAPDPLGEHAEGDALDRVQVDHAVPWHRVAAWFENDLTWQATDGRGAGSDDRPSQARNCGVARQHNHWPSPNLGKLAPPDVAPSGQRAHDAAAAARNDARSPHSSSSPSGWSS